MSGVILKPRFKNQNVFYKAEEVGPIGDVHQIVKLKHSCPEMPLRFDQTFSTARVGQNIQDGDSPSFNTGWCNAKTQILAFDRPSNNTISGGFTVENIIPEDREVIADTIPLPSYNWQNLMAQTFKAQVTGNAFLPLPGGFKPEVGAVPRGGAVPQISGGGGDMFAPLGNPNPFNPKSYYDPATEVEPGTQNPYLTAPYTASLSQNLNPMGNMAVYQNSLGAFNQRKTGFYN